MRVKLTHLEHDLVYLDSAKLYDVRQHYKGFWYFSVEEHGARSYEGGFDYKFSSKKDVTDIIEDIFYKEAEGNTVIYDFDMRLKQLRIELLK